VAYRLKHLLHLGIAHAGLQLVNGSRDRRVPLVNEAGKEREQSQDREHGRHAPAQMSI
jgi:hypothetical protein